jgi:hypothetical protein
MSTPRSFGSLEDAMRELQQRQARAAADDKPPDQGDVALHVQLPELIEIENTVRETIGPETR